MRRTEDHWASAKLASLCAVPRGTQTAQLSSELPVGVLSKGPRGREGTATGINLLCCQRVGPVITQSPAETAALPASSCVVWDKSLVLPESRTSHLGKGYNGAFPDSVEIKMFKVRT